MDNFINWLLGNSFLSTFLLILIGATPIIIILIYLFAFFQGRDISFWPPKIGGKPHSQILPQKHINPDNSIKSYQTPFIELPNIFSHLIKDNAISHYKGWKSCDDEIIEKILISKEVRILGSG